MTEACPQIHLGVDAVGGGGHLAVATGDVAGGSPTQRMQ